MGTRVAPSQSLWRLPQHCMPPGAQDQHADRAPAIMPLQGADPTVVALGGRILKFPVST